MITKWSPKGIQSLDRSAWKALSIVDKNVCIQAGPGAGKTELLAQKACYLFEKRICKKPQRILAISFKSDAANNLEKRVTERCSSEHASRFDSMTFDAFTKSFVDRFHLALPEKWRINPNYEIEFFNEKHYKSFLDEMIKKYPSLASEIGKLESFEFQNKILGCYQINTDPPEHTSDILCQEWILRHVSNNFDFLILSKLAELILRTNALISNALSMTYGAVFIDEFQDTTYAQYELLSTLLSRVDAAVTAVGDNKQKIMSWAGAKPNSFKEFKRTFGAVDIHLVVNYRSSPALVKIQQHLADSLEPGCPPISSSAPSEIQNEIAEIWTFDSSNVQNEYIVSWLKSDMQLRRLKPSDYAFLVRVRADRAHASLTSKFGEQGLEVSNEARKFGKILLQDIASDELFQFLSSLLRVSIQDGASNAWTVVSQCMEYFFPVEEYSKNEKQKKLIEKLISEQIKPLLSSFNDPSFTIERFFEVVMLGIGQSRIRGAFPQHHNDDYFENLLNSAKEFMVFCTSSSADWVEFIDKVDRVDQIPFLTIHKSKGLEYDTVILLELDDDSWWSYEENTHEENSALFVGLSRAKQRVIFTHVIPRQRRKLSKLYSLLRSAGVNEVDKNSN